jgi:hypothetical protein
MWEAVRVERAAEIQGWVAQYRFIVWSTIGHGRRAGKLLQQRQEGGNRRKSGSGIEGKRERRIRKRNSQGKGLRENGAWKRIKNEGNSRSYKIIIIIIIIRVYLTILSATQIIWCWMF